MLLNQRRVVKVQFTLDDGSTEEWDELDHTAIYRVCTNYRTRGKGSPTILESWWEHEVYWTSNRKRPSDVITVPPPIEHPDRRHGYWGPNLAPAALSDLREKLTVPTWFHAHLPYEDCNDKCEVIGGP